MRPPEAEARRDHFGRMGGDIRTTWRTQAEGLTAGARSRVAELRRSSRRRLGRDPLPDEGGRTPIGPSSSTARRLATEELKLAVLESVRDPIITIDEEGRIVDFNAAAESTFGHARRNVIDQPAVDLLVPERLRPCYRRALARARTSAEVPVTDRTIAMKGLRSDGREVPLDVSLSGVDLSGRRLLVVCARDMTSRRQEESLLSQLSALVEASSDAIIGHSLDGEITSWDEGAERLFGYGAEEARGQSIDVLLAPRDGTLALTEVASEGEPNLLEQETVVVTKDGNGLHLALTTSPVRNESGDVTHAVTIVRDISDRVEAEARHVELEQQLHQSQKMEAIGRLASGVAHDFNNLLSVIINYANFLAEDLEPGSTASDDIQRIRQAGHSAVGLVRQLLLFSRKEAVEPQIVDPNQMVLGMETLLRRTLGEDIRLETRLATDLWLTKIDPGQMEQILMNLAVNARDAMPHGGTLFIDTSNVTTDEYFARKTGADPGDYVRIAIGDDGPGMPPEVLSHIFEPFFTTKSEGEGTGLGLATVYAIVQGVQGCISVSSEPGVGTRFDIHLPATQEQQPAPEEDEPAVAHRGEGQRILLVEDEEAVRELAERILSANGYEVLSARSGREALELCSELDGPLRLLLSDVIMPHMSGKELAEWLRQVKPGFATIFMSGYTDQAVGSRALGEDGVSFLQKPFTADRLLQEVHKVLSGRQPISSSG